MATIAECFEGRVIEHDYIQTVAVEVIPSAFLDGKPIAFTRNLVTAKMREQTFRFQGLTEAQANSESQVTVVDASGVSYTFTPKSSFTDGSVGTSVFEKESVSVSREKMSPRMYSLVVTRRGGALFANGVKKISGPSWYDPS